MALNNAYIYVSKERSYIYSMREMGEVWFDVEAAQENAKVLSESRYLSG